MGALKAGVKGLRIAMPRDVVLDDLDSEIGRAFETAAGVFERLGASLMEISFPEAEPALGLGPIIAGAEACVAHEQRLDEMAPIVGPRMLADRDITAVQYIKALRTARDLRRSLAETLRDVDVLLMATTSRPALPLATVDTDLDTHAGYAKVYARNTRIGNVLDLCGLSVPCGFSEQELPIGLLLCGKPFTEDVVLRAGYAYEQATDWHPRTPDLAWLA